MDYHFKKDDESIERDNKNFFVEEATVALACLASVTNVVPLKRDMGDFWDLENKEKSNYRRLFNSGLSARTMWRAVQIARHVFKVVDSRCRAETKPERYKCYKHAKYLILHIVFIKSGLAHKSELELTPDQASEVSHETDLVAETVCNEGVSMFPHKEFYNVFKNITDCTDLKNKVMAKLAAFPIVVSASNAAATAIPTPSSSPEPIILPAAPTTPASPTPPPLTALLQSAENGGGTFAIGIVSLIVLTGDSQNRGHIFCLKHIGSVMNAFHRVVVSGYKHSDQHANYGNGHQWLRNSSLIAHKTTPLE